MSESVIVRQHVRIATGSSDEDGVLLFADGRLVAIVVRLSDPSHGNMRGHWYLEWAFGDSYCAPCPEPFPDVEAAEEWLIRHSDHGDI